MYKQYSTSVKEIVGDESVPLPAVSVRTVAGTGTIAAVVARSGGFRNHKFSEEGFFFRVPCVEEPAVLEHVPEYCAGG